MEEELYLLKLKDVKMAGDRLAEIFFEDPTSIYGLPDINKRQDKLRYAFRSIAHVCLKYGSLYATSPDLEGLIGFLNVSNYNQFERRFILSSIKKGIFRMGLGTIHRLSLFGKEIKRNHILYKLKSIKLITNQSKTAKIFHPYIYLMVIGVQKDHRGKGIGTKMLRFVIDESENQQLPIFLETELEQNVRFYEKNGFNIVEQVNVKKAGVTIWFMSRELS
ncbi:MAG: GNAT family N-acetyltransferase [Candidatus Lokiarchaeota archaeon]|nr:GNAT family N-acetyltransferase [Candidatus Harpocratesius repetitus]